MKTVHLSVWAEQTWSSWNESWVTLTEFQAESHLLSFGGGPGCQTGINLKKFFPALEAQLKVGGLVASPLTPPITEPSISLFANTKSAFCIVVPAKRTNIQVCSQIQKFGFNSRRGFLHVCSWQNEFWNKNKSNGTTKSSKAQKLWCCFFFFFF